MAALEAEIVPHGQFIPSFPAELNNRQKLFITYYLETRNGTKAAKLAGYEGDDNVLAVTASRLLTHAKVREVLDSYFQSRHLSADGVLAELSDIAFAPWKDFVEVKYGENGEVLQAILRPADKIKSLELMGKYHKLLTDRVETETTLSEDSSKQIVSGIVEEIMRQRRLMIEGKEVREE